MDIQYIKDKLNSSDYDFLRTDPHLGRNILILTTAGSIAYGTNVDASDIDIRGVTIESKQDIIGLSSFEQFEDRTRHCDLRSQVYYSVPEQQPKCSGDPGHKA